ncbi:Nucleoporin nup85 [Wickerhamiella sorbophila]|uniref:Nuclear pore complex protein Nup85 n=1 Tax=Wickerhamiella sorbophila TaxID=45607 RepID=A0A2T0FPS7_9ASCO|nr:Nucleoporin nup85 [Wickerhamiella sorbophila]PRT56967.1 Nucleoporin nup85 [Wickerhamiella sorbophila]
MFCRFVMTTTGVFSQRMDTDVFTGAGSSNESVLNEKTTYTLLEPSLTPEEVTLILETHRLMAEYSDTRLAHPFEVEEITAKYLDLYINMLTNALPTLRDPVALVDSLAVLRCLKAVYFGGSLMEWVQAADPGWDIEGAAELLKVEDPRANPILWRYLSETATAGRLSTVHTALSESVSSVWDSLEKSVQECISDTLYLCNSFQMGSRDSKKMAINLRVKCEQLEDVEWSSHLSTLAKILQGNKDTIVRAAPSWHTAVGGLYMYVDPSLEELPEYYKLAIARHPVDRTLDWEEACAALMEKRLLFALASLKQLDTAAAMVCADFCHQQGLLGDYSYPTKSSIREYVALQHVLICLSNPDLVLAGFEMLDNMSVSRAARDLASQVLPQLVARDPTLMDTAIELATELRLESTVSELLGVNAERAATEGDIVTAVEAFVSSGDLTAARQACWSLFETSIIKGYMATTDASSLEILQSDTAPDMSSSVLACLAPCAVLNGLFAAINESRQDAKTLVRALLSFPAMPAVYYPLLVALISQLDLRDNADPATVALLISSLDRWDALRPSERERGLELLDSGRSAEWARDVDDAATPSEIVWMLRRRLAYDVIVL